jgi:hypothetical protein
VQKLCPERVWGPRSSNKNEKMCGAFGTTQFVSFIAQSRPPDPLRTQVLRNFCFLNFWMDYRCLRKKCPSKPYEFMGFGAMDVTKPYEFIGLCYAILLPGRKSAFRDGFWPDCYRESTEIGPSAGRRPAFGRPGGRS